MQLGGDFRQLHMAQRRQVHQQPGGRLLLGILGGPPGRPAAAHSALLDYQIIYIEDTGVHGHEGGDAGDVGRVHDAGKLLVGGVAPELDISELLQRVDVVGGALDVDRIVVGDVADGTLHGWNRTG